MQFSMLVIIFLKRDVCLGVANSVPRKFEKDNIIILIIELKEFYNKTGLYIIIVKIDQILLFQIKNKSIKE